MPAAAASAVSQPSQPATELGSSGARELSGSSGREIMRSFATIREMLAARGMDTTSIDGQPMVELLARCGAERQDVFCVDIESCGVRVVYDLHPKLKMTDIRKQLDGAHQTYIVVAREKSPLSKTSTLAAASAASAAAAASVASASAAAAAAAAAASVASAASPSPPDASAASAASAASTAVVVGGAAAAAAAPLAREVQVFEFAELQYNLSKHTLVPPHTAIRNEADIDEVLRRYTLKSRYQLPLILSTDPMARYLALKPGQLVRIVRESPSAGTYVLYRCCQRA